MQEEGKKGISNSVNIIINVALLLITIGIAYSWMVTDSSDGEIVKYDRDLIVSSLDISVVLYQYIDKSYVEVTADSVDLTNVAPGDVYQFRFDITNEHNTVSLSKIVFGAITGDVDVLAPYVIIGSTSPNIYSFLLSDKIVESENADGDIIKIARFNDSLKVPAKTTLSLYWYISISEDADNSIVLKHISIDNIEFISP